MLCGEYNKINPARTKSTINKSSTTGSEYIIKNFKCSLCVKVYAHTKCVEKSTFLAVHIYTHVFGDFIALNDVTPLVRLTSSADFIFYAQPNAHFFFPKAMKWSIHIRRI